MSRGPRSEENDRSPRKHETATNVSELRRAEDALRTSEGRLKKAQAIAHLGSWELDLLTNELSWSDEVYRIFGLQPQEFRATYEAFLDAVHPDDRAAVDAAYSGSLRDGRDSYEIEHRIVRKATGEVRIVHEKCEHLRNAAGEIVASVGMVHDVTDRRLAEAVVAESRRKTISILESITDCCFELDSESRFTYVNERALGFFGRPLEDFLGRCYRDVFPAAVGSMIEGNCRRAIAEQRPVHFEALSVVFDRWAEFHAHPSGQALAVYFRDITHRRRAEEALREANERLREADQHKNEFLAVLSHELRNPLAPIRHSLFVLERAEPGGEQAAFAQAVIDRQVRQLARLVDDLLDMTRVSRNKIELKRQPIDFSDVVRRSADDQRSVFERNGVRLETAVPEHPIIVNGDHERLAQVVGNLLQNAAKFTPAGGSVRISIEPETAAGHATLHVADTGVGMDGEVLARLFQPFMQADHTLERSKGGLGLGLALVKGLVDLHGGEVTAHSDGLGKGSVFTVRLPLDATAPAEPPAHRAAPGGCSRRILVIEDHADAAESLREMLQCMGHTVAIAHDGFDGLAMSRTFRPDVILCDIGLPGMNGYEVARALRADPQMAGVRLIAISGYALPEDLQRTAEAGFDEHIAKPPSPEKLASLLGSVPRGTVTLFPPQFGKV